MTKATEIRFAKRQGAEQGQGRGADNSYTPGQYSILRDGEEIGFIAARSQRHYEKADWAAYLFEPGNRIPRPFLRHFPTLRETKARIIKHFEKEGD